MAPGVVDAARRSTDRARYRVGGLRDGGALAIPTASRIDGPSVRRVGTFTGSGTVHNVRSAGERSIAAGVDAVLSVPARDAGVLARRPAGCVTCAPAGAEARHTPEAPVWDSSACTSGWARFQGSSRPPVRKTQLARASGARCSP